MINWVKNNRNKSLLIFILVVAAGLRLFKLGSFSFSNDELSAIYRLQFDSLRELVRNGIWVDGHPAGVQVFLYFWTKLFGISEFALRLPFAIAGVLAVFFGYKTTKNWFGPTPAFFVAAVLAVFEFPLLYSRIARPYGSGLFLVLFLTWIWSIVLFEDEDRPITKRIINVIVLGFAFALNLYNHYFSALMVIIIGLSGVFFLKRKTILYYFGAAIIAFIIFIPHIKISLHHFSLEGVGQWLAAPNNNWIIDHLFYCLNESRAIVLLVISIILMSFILKPNKLTNNKFRVISLAWFLIPFLTGFIYSRQVNPVLQNSVLIFSMPFLFIFVFSFLNIELKRFNKIMFIHILLIGAYTTVIKKDFYSKEHFLNFKEAANKITDWSDWYGKENITWTININNPFYINYYLEKENLDIDFKLTSTLNENEIYNMKEVLKTANTPCFAFINLRPGQEIITDMIRATYPHLIWKTDKRTGIYLFSKERTHFNSMDGNRIKFVEKCIENYLEWDIVQFSKNDTLLPDSVFCYNMKGIEFGPTYTDTINKNENFPVRSEIFVKNLSGQNTDAHLVISIEDKNGKNIFWKSAKIDYFDDQKTWARVVFTHPLPEADSDGNIVKIYIWNPEKREILIDGFTINN